MIERQAFRSGAIQRSVRDERGDHVIGGRVAQDDDGSFYIDWVANPTVDRLSVATLGEVLEVARDLRENVWALTLLREQR